MIIFTILKAITIIAIFQTVLLSINLFRKTKSNVFCNLILALLFLSFGIFLTGNSLVFLSQYELRFNIFHLVNLVVFLSAPLLYLYIEARINNKSKFSPNDIIHLIPFLIISGFMGNKIINSYNVYYDFDKYGILFLSLLFFQNMIYLYFIVGKLSDRGINVFGKVKKVSNLEYNWIRSLFRVFMVILFFPLLIFLVCSLFTGIEICVVFTGIFFTISFILINSIVLLGLSKPTIFEFKLKYKHSKISNDIKAKYLNSLENALKNDKVYLDPLLTLERLSKKLNIPKNHLSQIINENFDLNFNDFINQYRVNEVKNIFNADNNNTSILEIAYSVGYNSKSTFNTAFKKITGITPSEFKKQSME